MTSCSISRRAYSTPWTSGSPELLNEGDACTRVTRLALTYLAFTHEKPKLWNLLFEHHMPAGSALPAWYQQKLETLMSRVETALAPEFGPGQDAERQRAARVLWAGVHGITSLSTADKLSVVTTETANRLIEDLVATYLPAFRCGQDQRRARNATPLEARRAP